jgi:hypothetical protein
MRMNEDLLGLLIFLLLAVSALVNLWRSKRSTPEPPQAEHLAEQGSIDQAASAVDHAAELLVQARPSADDGRALLAPARPPSAARHGRSQGLKPSVPAPRQAMIAIAVYGPCLAEQTCPPSSQIAGRSTQTREDRPGTG